MFCKPYVWPEFRSNTHVKNQVWPCSSTQCSGSATQKRFTGDRLTASLVPGRDLVYGIIVQNTQTALSSGFFMCTDSHTNLHSYTHEIVLFMYMPMCSGMYIPEVDIESCGVIDL